MPHLFQMGTSDWLGAGARVGDYVIEREIGAKPGLLAWSAKHTLLPRRARITTVSPAFASTPVLGAELTREACILEVLRHSGVPRVYECGELRDGRPWIATELIEGPSLAGLLAQEGRLGVPMVLTLLAGVAEILHYAHTRGLVHRNLCPDAIASRPEGPCIVDWRNARSREGDAPQRVPADRFAYQPPEVVGGDPADSRADVFALGAIAYEALTGLRSAPEIARRFPAAPARLVALLDRMVARDPLVRPTAAEVRAEALAIVEQIEIPVPSADEEGPDVQIEDVELGFGLAAESLASPDEEPGPAASMTMSPPADATLTWSLQDLDERSRTRPPSELPFDATRTQTESMMALPAELLLARTRTEPMTAEHLARTKTDPMMVEHLTRTKTDPMMTEHLVVPRAPTEPPSGDQEPRPPRTSTRMGKLARS